jgi:hypothetical protein
MHRRRRVNRSSSTRCCRRSKHPSSLAVFSRVILICLESFVSPSLSQNAIDPHHHRHPLEYIFDIIPRANSVHA